MTHIKLSSILHHQICIPKFYLKVPCPDLSCTSEDCVGTQNPTAIAILQGLSLLFLHSLAHTQIRTWTTVAQWCSRSPRRGKSHCQLTPPPAALSSLHQGRQGNFPHSASDLYAQKVTEPSWVSASRQGNVSWSAAYRLLHKSSLFAYSVRDAALGMISSHSKHSMTTIQAIGAESLEGGREAKEKKNIFSGCLECYKLWNFFFLFS